MYTRGYGIGWDWGKSYAAGSKQVRALIRFRLRRMLSLDSAFVQGVYVGLQDFCEQRAEAIHAGLAPRTVNPHKLSRLAERMLDTAVSY